MVSLLDAFLRFCGLRREGGGKKKKVGIEKSRFFLIRSQKLTPFWKNYEFCLHEFTFK